jgi:DNA invertase Pin-like site-specific DNA recombinase
VVLVWSLDRILKEGSAAILNIINTLGQYRVKVLSYQESWTEAPGQLGELLFAIAGWVAKMESERRSERTLAGLARAVRKGKKLGRPTGSRDKQKRKRTGYLLRYAKRK